MWILSAENFYYGAFYMLSQLGINLDGQGRGVGLVLRGVFRVRHLFKSGYPVYLCVFPALQWDLIIVAEAEMVMTLVMVVPWIRR